MKMTGKIKMLFVFAIAMMFANNVQAQDTTNQATNYDQGFRLGFGLNAGYAMNDPYKLVLGADVRGQYDLSERYSLTLTTGFTNLFVSKADGPDLGIIPAKAGFKAFVWEDQFYVMGEAGAAFAVNNVENTRDRTSLLLSPSIGFASKYIDISLNYTHYNHFDRLNSNNSIGRGVGHVGVRLAYGFQL